MAPHIEVVEMKNSKPLLAGSDIVNTVDTDTNIGIGFGGGGFGPAASKDYKIVSIPVFCIRIPMFL